MTMWQGYMTIWHGYKRCTSLVSSKEHNTSLRAHDRAKLSKSRLLWRARKCSMLRHSLIDRRAWFWRLSNRPSCLRRLRTVHIQWWAVTVLSPFHHHIQGYPHFLSKHQFKWSAPCGGMDATSISHHAIIQMFIPALRLFSDSSFQRALESLVNVPNLPPYLLDDTRLTGFSWSLTYGTSLQKLSTWSFRPWSPWILSGTPKLQIQFFTSTFTQVVALWLGIGNASVHFVKLYCTVKMCRFPLRVRGNGPTMSMWIVCIGFPHGIGCRGALGLGLDLHFAHVRQSPQYWGTPLVRSGLQNLAFIFFKVFIHPKWAPAMPSWTVTSASLKNSFGKNILLLAVGASRVGLR